MVTLILVDSNVWIFLNVENLPEHPAARKRIEDIRKGGIVTNIIVISEVFHQLSRLLGTANALERVNKMLESSDTHFVPIEHDTASKTVQLAGKKPIRINDAVIASHALKLKIPILTDNVKDFRKISGLKVLPLR